MTVETETKVQQSADGSTTVGQSAPNTTEWVHFDEDATPPAVLNTESVQVNLERSNNNAISAVSDGNIGNLEPKPLQTVQLQVQEPVRQGFCKYLFGFQLFVLMKLTFQFFLPAANGDVIVTLLPVNTRFPWITPAQFRPELVPEELMAQGLTVSELNRYSN